MNELSEAAQNALRQTNFTVWDWTIVIAYLGVSLVIGLFVKKYVKSMAGYVSAGRAVGPYLGIATMAGTELGLITVMYAAQKGFTGGFAAFHIALVAAIVTFVVGVTGFIVYRLRQFEVLTIPEFYGKRFGPKTRFLGGVLLVFGGVLNMGLFLKVGSMFIVGITGLSGSGWALPAVMGVLLVLVLVYTVLGGMISVVVTDYIQFVVLSVGLLVASAFAVSELGWNEIFAGVHASLGEQGFNPLVEGEFGVSYVIWMAFLGLVSCAIWPTAIARALAMESPAAVKRQYRWSSLAFLIRFLIPYFWGICALVFIQTQADDLRPLFFPDAGADPELPDLYAMPVFLGRILPAGIIGLISAAMIAAFMSTHDSYLLCWSSVITQDIVAPVARAFGISMSTESRVRTTRVGIVVIGLYIFAWGVFYTGDDDIWDYMAVTGAIYFSGAFAVLIGGLYWRRASSTGAVFALLAGSSAIFGLGPVREKIGITLSSAEVGLLSIGLTCLALVLGSLLVPDNKPADGFSSAEEAADTEAEA